MTAPNLPMRERIAEALHEHGGWYTRVDEGSFCDCDHHLAPAGVSAVKAWEAHRADALLAVLADLSGTAVEAGAEALFEEERNASMSGVPWPEWEEMEDDFGGDGKEPYMEIVRAVLTAAIAAIKEGKA